MEIVSTIIGCIGQEIVGKLLNAAGRQFGYFCKYNDKVEALGNQTKKLKDARDGVQTKIVAAEKKGEPIEAAVQTWINEVDSIAAQADNLLKDEDKANKNCLGMGWCFMPCSRYRFSKEAQKKTRDISKLQEEGKFENVSSPAPPPGIISSSMEIFSKFKSRKLIMEQIMNALSDENVSLIGICGMGGVGKTTLVEEIGQQAKVEKQFDEVAMAVVSRNKRDEIQEEIANMLTDTSLPTGSLEARARSLWARIKRENRILIILDDLWEWIELDKIGIPSGENHKGCKIVLTSRSKDVCKQMAAKPIEMGALSKTESWFLFKEVAGLVDDDSDINATARKVADKCDGLPLAILTVAKALKDEEESLWLDAEQRLNNCRATYIKGIDPKTIAGLELSYDYLKSQEEKSLFLFCCLFPEDFKIPIDLLGRYGYGLNWFVKVDKVEEARNRAYTVVSTLTSSFLLMNDKKGFVKMHDVVRDVAIAIASKNNNIFTVKSGMKLQDWPSINKYEDHTGISLMLNDLREMPDHGLECPKLEALLLQQNSSLVIPSNCFQGMKDLKVLDLSDVKLVPLPQSLIFLANLRTLCLSSCKLGDDLSVIGELSRLEILDLSGSDIKEIPASFGQLSSLRLLDMNYCRELKLISPGVVSRFAKLEELFMLRCFPSWNVANNARIDELQHLSQLTKLMIHIPTCLTYPNFIYFQKLKSFNLSFGLFNENLYAIQEVSRNREVMLSHCTRTSGPLLDWAKDLLNRSQWIILDSIKGTENIIGDLVSKRFTHLDKLSVRNCSEVKYLIDTSKSAPHVMFPNLETLTIGGSGRLVEICHGLLPAEAFRKLTVLNVYRCSSILYIVPPPLLQRLQSLREISVKSNKSVTHVFDLRGLEILNEESQFLSSLEDVSLADLHKMTHIWKGDLPFLRLERLKNLGLWNCNALIKLFPQPLSQSLISLEKIEVSGCSNLEEIFEKKQEDKEKERVLWEQCHANGLGNLTEIYVESCVKLVNLFTASIARSLVLLRKLNVSCCTGMQEIVSIEEGESAERMTFRSLCSMELKGLDNLTYFFPGRCPIEFPVLETLKIVECPKMMTFGCGDQLTPKLSKVNLGGKRQWMENLNDTVQKFFREQLCMTKEGASKTSKPNEKHREIHTEEVPVHEAEKRCVQVLPHNYEDIIQDADSPIDRSSICKVYDQLCSGIFLNKNTKKYWIEKDSQANSFMLFARNMYLEWIDYWKWTPVKETSACDVMVDAAELLEVWWLEVKATFDTKKLSPGITYEVSFAIMLKEESYGWEVPLYLEMQLENGIKQGRRENLLTKPKNRWIEIPVAEFITAPENDGQMKITLDGTGDEQWKSGLIIKGILIQPKI